MSKKTKFLIWWVSFFNDKLSRKNKYPYPHYYFVSGMEIGFYKGSCEVIKKLSYYGIESNVTVHGITICVLRHQKPVLRQFLKEVQFIKLRDTKYQQLITESWFKTVQGVQNG